MSDTPQGPGWWIASDGRYYPPKLHPAGTPAPPPPAFASVGAPVVTPSGLSKPQTTALIAAAVVLVSAFLPWATVSTIFGSLSVSGFQNGEGDGVITAIVAVVGGLCAWKGGRALVATLLAGLAAGGIGLYDWRNVARLSSDAEGVAIAEAGIGLYGTIAGGAALVVVAIAAITKR